MPFGELSTRLKPDHFGGPEKAKFVLRGNRRSSADCKLSIVDSSIEAIMQHNLSHTIALLTRTPAALNAFLRDLPEAWTFCNEGGNTWSAFDVVGHLIHGERTDWM